MLRSKEKRKITGGKTRRDGAPSHEDCYTEDDRRIRKKNRHTDWSSSVNGSNELPNGVAKKPKIRKTDGVTKQSGVSKTERKISTKRNKKSRKTLEEVDIPQNETMFVIFKSINSIVVGDYEAQSQIHF